MESRAIAALLRERQAAVVSAVHACMRETSDDEAARAGFTEEDTRQYISGFLAVVEAAAEGDNGPRDDYLATMIPATKGTGLSLGSVLGGMVGVASGLCHAMPTEALPWCGAFLRDYTVRLLEVWDAS